MVICRCTWQSDAGIDRFLFFENVYIHLRTLLDDSHHDLHVLVFVVGYDDLEVDIAGQQVLQHKRREQLYDMMTWGLLLGGLKQVGQRQHLPSCLHQGPTCGVPLCTERERERERIKYLWDNHQIGWKVIPSLAGFSSPSLGGRSSSFLIRCLTLSTSTRKAKATRKGSFMAEIPRSHIIIPLILVSLEL